jgi:hypothetical protein
MPDRQQLGDGASDSSDGVVIIFCRLPADDGIHLNGLPRSLTGGVVVLVHRFLGC